MADMSVPVAMAKTLPLPVTKGSNKWLHIGIPMPSFRRRLLVTRLQFPLCRGCVPILVAAVASSQG
eukprot:5869786-Amphidinium_carterae.1